MLFGQTGQVLDAQRRRDQLVVVDVFGDAHPVEPTGDHLSRVEREQPVSDELGPVVVVDVADHAVHPEAVGEPVEGVVVDERPEGLGVITLINRPRP